MLKVLRIWPVGVTTLESTRSLPNASIISVDFFCVSNLILKMTLPLFPRVKESPSNDINCQILQSTPSPKPAQTKKPKSRTRHGGNTKQDFKQHLETRQ